MHVGTQKVLKSQHEIEKYIQALLPTPGFFLEIGCWDGINISQTYIIEKQGWTGICVDPFPKHFEKRKCQLIQKAISKDGGQREFIRVTEDRRYMGDVSYLSGFKEKVTTGLHWPLIQEHCNYEEIKVDTIPISELLSRCPDHIDFLSVDVEGGELEIFQGIDFSRYSFGLIVFEHNYDEETKKGVAKILEDEYVLYKDLDIDTIYINKILSV